MTTDADGVAGSLQVESAGLRRRPVQVEVNSPESSHEEPPGVVAACVAVVVMAVVAHVTHECIQGITHCCFDCIWTKVENMLLPFSKGFSVISGLNCVE